MSESSPRHHILPRRLPCYFFEARSAESKFSLRTDLRSLSAASSAPAHARSSARTAALTRGASSIHYRAVVISDEQWAAFVVRHGLAVREADGGPAVDGMENHHLRHHLLL